MRAQRVREGESRIEMQVVKWTAEAQSKVRYQNGYDVNQVFCDVGHTLVAGDMQVSRKAHGITP